MRIDANNLAEVTQKNTGVQNKDGKSVLIENVCTKEVDKKSGSTYSVKSVTYEKPLSEEKTDVEELEKEGFGADGAWMKQQMAILSNITSENDYEKLEEKGYGGQDVEVEGIVTVVDKIKAELAKAGVDTQIFGEELSTKDLEEITGSTAVANQITRALQAADLPETEENLTETKEALEIAESLEAPSDATIKYMLENEMEPTIENLYMAEHSTAKNYLPQTEESIDVEALQEQIEKVLQENGFEVTEENIQDSKWLVEQGIPLTEETLNSYQELKALKLPAEGTEVLQAITDAIAQGKRPKEAILSITARRQLEEVRLEMSAKANYAHGKEGVAIDTESIAQTVEELKQAEETYYKNLLEQGGVEATEENVATFRQIEQTIEEMKQVPAYTLGILEGTPETPKEIHREGKILQDTFEKANESYETLMTAPRRDMGDSIQKAFRNVDDILEDCGIEATEANRRAVRILAYNNQEITPESILKIKAVDEEVQQTFRNMTPQVVREMIKTGVNPLDMNVVELNEKAMEIRQELNIDNEEERFSKYLHKLEQNSEIAEEERSAYIGIYRLIAQVEKTDGAAIGMLAAQSGEMTMRNLITAVRSSKKEGREYTIDEEFGGLESVETKTSSITEQIEAGYQKNCLKDVMRELSPERLAQIPDWESMTPEQLKGALEQIPQKEELEKAYTQEQMASYGACAVASEEVYQMLEQYDLPKTVNSILALQQMMSNRNGAFRKLFSQAAENPNTDIRQLQQQAFSEFAEALKSPEDMAEAQQKLAETAENVMKGMINETEVSTLDLKEMKLAKTQIELGTKMAKEETYQIPVLVGDSVTGISLKIVRGKEEKGRVDILFGGENIGQVAAQIATDGEKLEAYIVSDSQSTLEAFRQQEELFLQMLKEESGQKAELHYVQAKEPQKVHMLQTKGEEEISEKTEVQTKTLYHMAESFIKTVQVLNV